MGKEEYFHILVAEEAPVIAGGFVVCLKKIKSPYLNVTEVNHSLELKNYLYSHKVDILMINPYFGGIFNPQKLKEEIGYPISIIAIETGKLNKQTAILYDGTIHVTDDFDTINKKIKDICGLKDKKQEEKETLSVREKEIISLVVKGLTNQEIADKLFLSIHTVITHRRNIARKLEIHSATGLTIYAIVNKIVNLEDVVK